MIYETYYWRLELGRLSRRLRDHMAQRHWPSASDASVEKCVMLGFYSIRKLIQAFHPPPNMPTQIKVTTFPRNQQKLSPICWPEVTEAFDLDKPTNETLDLEKLCNQVIHSYFFSVWLGKDRVLRGVFLSSDYKKNEKVFRVEISTIVNIFEQVASSRHKYASLVHFYPDNNRVVM